MLTLRKIRELTLRAASAQGRPGYLSAASGLVRTASHIFVVADDELHLGVFALKGAEPGVLARLFDGELPVDGKARKKQKPDLEALTRLPSCEGYPHGALLACGSGSRANRRRGAMVGLDATGAIDAQPQAVDLACIMDPLGVRFPVVNVEGVLVSDSDLLVFQRGNTKNGVNAIARFPLDRFLKALRGGSEASLPPPVYVDVDLGLAGGVPLSFTDAALLPGGAVVFSAVAEDTDDPYLDGACAGAAIGLLDASGELRWMRQLTVPHKIEGVDAVCDGDVINLLLVTDADDIAVPAALFSTRVRMNGDPLG